MDRGGRSEAAASLHRGHGSSLLAFSGLWDRWKDPLTGKWILSCSIIVTGANTWMQAYHDRMAVRLRLRRVPLGAAAAKTLAAALDAATRAVERS
jgi:putative SOS response-associated peptidase YedK